MSLSITNRPLRACWIDVACSTQLSKIKYQPRAGGLPNLGWVGLPSGRPVRAPYATHSLCGLANLAEQFLGYRNELPLSRGSFEQFLEFLLPLFSVPSPMRRMHRGLPARNPGSPRGPTRSGRNGNRELQTDGRPEATFRIGCFHVQRTTRLASLDLFRNRESQFGSVKHLLKYKDEAEGRR
jgi:hypothetical protein